jgi:hypothetical protein
VLAWIAWSSWSWAPVLWSCFLDESFLTSTPLFYLTLLVLFYFSAVYWYHYCNISIWECHSSASFCIRPRYWMAGRTWSNDVSLYIFSDLLHSTCCFWTQITFLTFIIPRELELCWMDCLVQEMGPLLQCNDFKLSKLVFFLLLLKNGLFVENVMITRPSFDYSLLYL